MANVLDNDREDLDFADESDSMEPEVTSEEPVTGYDFPHCSEYTFTLRHVVKVEVDGEDGMMRLACRAENGAKVWLNIVGLTPGEILNQALFQLSKGN